LNTVGNVPHAPVEVFLGNPRVPGKKLGVKLENVKSNPLQVRLGRKEIINYTKVSQKFQLR
jgi:hypothetical protein